MKSLLIASFNGGTGRTALVCQLAHYLRLVRRQRVLVIDLAEPADCTDVLARGGCAHVVAGGLPPHMCEGQAAQYRAGIDVLPAHAIPGLKGGNDPARARYYANLRYLIAVIQQRFDVCLIDSAPFPDLRTVCAAALVDAMVSPVGLSSEGLSGADLVVNGVYGVRNIRAKLNPQLHFVGLLPVLVEPTSTQRACAVTLQDAMSGWMIADPRRQHAGSFVQLPRLDAIARAQAFGVSVRQLQRDDAGARDAWGAVRACLDVLASHLDWTEGAPFVRREVRHA